MKQIFTCALLLFAGIIQAQSVNNDILKNLMVKDWERAKLYTNEYLDAMPADKYNWRPVDSIRSFAEQMLHLAQGNIGLVSNGTDKPRIWVGRNLEKSSTAHGKDSVKYYVNASYDFAIDALKAMDVSKAGDMVKRGTIAESKLSWIQKGFEHQTHHRGQATIYIRMQGIRPPAERLF